MYVLNDKTALFSINSFWDPTLNLDAGVPVCILEVSDFIFLPNWYRVETANEKTGWLSEIALGTSREYLDLKYESRPTLVILPPAALGLDPFYQKYLDAQGLLIVSSWKVPDAALYQAAFIIDEMLINRPDLRARIVELGVRLAIMADSEVTTDIPEYSDLYQVYPGTDWDTRGRGFGPSRVRPVTSTSEENLLCYAVDAYAFEDILVHEMAHTALEFGVERIPGGAEFLERLNAAYDTSMIAGLWASTYAAENRDEYWAEGVQSWFGLNDPPGWIHNGVNTRAELKAYDPELASLIKEVFGDTEVTSSCHNPIGEDITAWIRGIVTGPDGSPLEGIELWAWQGTLETSGFGRTGPGGAFAIGVPSGTFTLDVWAGPGCSWVGWYDGNGITTGRTQAVRGAVSGEDISDVEIRLPALPDHLPRVEHCK